MSHTLELAKALMRCESVTPNDAGCMEIIAERLARMDFTIERLRFDDVDNLWARRGDKQPLFVFAGHTDVVPPGPLEQWTSPPFEPTERDGYLYGRGAVDMKTSLAAMITACETFVEQNPKHEGSIAFLITSDEEGPAKNGTVKVIEHLQKQDITFDYCLIGEPTSDKALGDTIKHGRRGSLSGHLIIHGKQGHIAYPQLAENPIHKATAFLTELTNTVWDKGNKDFPPTSLQLSNIHAGTGALNVIPANLAIDFNFRYSTASTHKALQTKTEALLKTHKLNHTINWTLSSEPFLTKNGKLIEATQATIKKTLNHNPQLSTAGGTSDGRFIHKTNCELIELGMENATAHQVNECVKTQHLETLSKTYTELLHQILQS